MHRLLGIDLGTSSAKAVLTTETGQVLGRGGAEYAIRRPRPDWAEQDTEDWWRAAVIAVRKAVAADADGDGAVAGIGLSGQMHGTVLLDGAGCPMMPAIIWPDRRSQRQVEEITALLGAKHIIERTGSPVATGFQAATIRWIQEHRPEVWQRAGKVLLPKDYLRFRLTGDYATDPSDGSGALLLDVHRRDWSPEVLSALHMDEAHLPPVRPSAEVAGHLSGPAADALGLRVGVPVAVGAADTACSMLGAGVTNPHALLVTISTGGQLVLPAREVRLDLAGRVHTFCGSLEPGPGQAGWYLMGATLAAGLSLRWLRDQVLGLAGDEGYEQMTALAADVSAGAHGLLFLPYLGGERTPHMDSSARGVFLGLTLNHGRAEMVRAVMEGVALGCLDAYQVLTELGAAPEQIVMAGGGVRSRLWQQILADVFALPVQPLIVADQSTLGAAILGGASVGLFDAAGAAGHWAARGSAIEPDERRHSVYAGLLPLFRELYLKHREDFRHLALT